MKSKKEIDEELIKSRSDERIKKQFYIRQYLEQIKEAQKTNEPQEKTEKLPDPNPLQGFKTKLILEVQPNKNSRDAEKIKSKQPLDQNPTKDTTL